MPDRRPAPGKSAEGTAEVYAGASTEPADLGQVPHVVVVGAACRDIAADDPRGWRLGGGATYSTLTMARLGARTGAVLGVDSLAAGAAELDVIRATRASLRIADLEHGPVFENIELPGGRIQICVATSSRIPTAAAPAAWAAAPVWILAPVADEIGDDWAVVPPADAVVAVAWQGMLRELVAGERVRRRTPVASALVARADLVAASHHDIAPGAAVDELVEMLKPGASFLLTKGADGGILWRRATDGRITGRRYPALVPDRVIDATGAGDTFLAALVSTWLVPELARLRDRGGDLRFAAAAGSLVVEGHGLEGVPDLGAVVRRARRSIGAAPQG